MQRPTHWLSAVEYAPAGSTDGGVAVRGTHEPRERQTSIKKNEPGRRAIKPWRVKEWIIPSADASFVCAMEAVLDVYERPYDAAHPVVNLDESPLQLVSECRQGFTNHQGVEHIDYDGAARAV